MLNRFVWLLVVCVSGGTVACSSSSDEDDNPVMSSENEENNSNDPGTDATEVSVSTENLGTELTLQTTFPTQGGIGLAFDRATDTLWTYGGSTFRQYDRDGNLLVSLTPETGENANDADIDFADADFSLAGTDIQAGTLLFTNGETDAAEVYAVSVDGTVLATLNSSFGNSHVVGSAYSVLRGTFFMVQDGVPAAEFDNLLAEVDASNGDVLNTFDLDELENSFTVNFGDLEVDNVSGNVLVVSSSQSEILVLTPEFEELSRWSIAEGSEGSLAASGIALDEARGELYVQSNSGDVSRFTYPN